MTRDGLSIETSPVAGGGLYGGGWSDLGGLPDTHAKPGRYRLWIRHRGGQLVKMTVCAIDGRTAIASVIDEHDRAVVFANARAIR